MKSFRKADNVENESEVRRHEGNTSVANDYCVVEADSVKTESGIHTLETNNGGETKSYMKATENTDTASEIYTRGWNHYREATSVQAATNNVSTEKKRDTKHEVTYKTGYDGRENSHGGSPRPRVTLADLITACRDRGLHIYNDEYHVPTRDRINTPCLSQNNSETVEIDKYAGADSISNRRNKHCLCEEGVKSSKTVDIGKDSGTVKTRNNRNSTSPRYKTNVDKRNVVGINANGARTKSNGDTISHGKRHVVAVKEVTYTDTRRQPSDSVPTHSRMSQRTDNKDSLTPNGGIIMRHNNNSKSDNHRQHADLSFVVSSAAVSESIYRRGAANSRASTNVRDFLAEDIDAEEMLQQRMRRRSRRRQNNNNSLEEILQEKQRQDNAYTSQYNVTHSVTANDKRRNIEENNSNQSNEGNEIGNHDSQPDSLPNQELGSQGKAQTLIYSNMTMSRKTVKNLDCCDGNFEIESKCDTSTGKTEANDIKDIVIKDGKTTLLLTGYNYVDGLANSELQQCINDLVESKGDNIYDLRTGVQGSASTLTTVHTFSEKNNASCNTNGIHFNTHSCNLSKQIDAKNNASSKCRKHNTSEATGACNYGTIDTSPGHPTTFNNCIDIYESRGNRQPGDVVIKDASVVNNTTRDVSFILCDSSENRGHDQYACDMNGNGSPAVNCTNRVKECDTPMVQFCDSGIGSDSEKEIGFTQLDSHTSPSNNVKQFPLLGRMRRTIRSKENTDSVLNNNEKQNKRNIVNINNALSVNTDNGQKTIIEQNRVSDTIDSIPAKRTDKRGCITNRHTALDAYRQHIHLLKRETNFLKSGNVSDLDSVVNSKVKRTVMETDTLAEGQSEKDVHGKRINHKNNKSPYYERDGMVSDEKASNADIGERRLEGDKTATTSVTGVDRSNKVAMGNDVVNDSHKHKKTRDIRSRSPIASTSRDDTSSYKTTATTMKSTPSSNKNVSAARLFLLMTKLHETYDEEKYSQYEYLELVDKTRRELKRDWLMAKSGAYPLPEEGTKNSEKDIGDKQPDKKDMLVKNNIAIDRTEKHHDDIKPTTDNRQSGELNNNEKELISDHSIAMNSDIQHSNSELRQHGQKFPKSFSKKVGKKIDNEWSPDHPAYKQIITGFKSNSVIPCHKRIMKELNELTGNKFNTYDLLAASVYVQEAKRLYPKGFKDIERKKPKIAHGSGQASVRFAKLDMVSGECRRQCRLVRQSTPFNKHKNPSIDRQTQEVNHGTHNQRLGNLSRSQGMDRVTHANHTTRIPVAIRRVNTICTYPDIDELAKEKKTVTEYQGNMQNKVELPMIATKQPDNHTTRIPVAIRRAKASCTYPDIDELAKEKKTVMEYQGNMQNKVELPMIATKQPDKRTHIPVSQNKRSNFSLPLAGPARNNVNSVSKCSEKNNNNSSIKKGNCDIQDINKRTTGVCGSKVHVPDRNHVVSNTSSRPTDNITMNIDVDIVNSRKMFYHDSEQDMELSRQVRVLRLHRQLSQIKAGEASPTAADTADVTARTETSEGDAANNATVNAMENVSKFLLMDYNLVNARQSFRKSDAELNNFLRDTMRYEVCAKGRSLYNTSNRRDKALDAMRKLYDRNYRFNNSNDCE